MDKKRFRADVNYGWVCFFADLLMAGEDLQFIGYLLKCVLWLRFISMWYYFTTKYTSSYLYYLITKQSFNLSKNKDMF